MASSKQYSSLFERLIHLGEVEVLDLGSLIFVMLEYAIDKYDELC